MKIHDTIMICGQLLLLFVCLFVYLLLFAS